MDGNVGGVLALPQYTTLGLRLLAHPLEEGVGAGHRGLHPPAHYRDPGGIQSVLGTLGVGPHQAPRPQQHPAKVPGHHTAHVGDLLPLEHVEHGLAGGALGLSVVGVALHAAFLDAVAPAVVAGVVVLLLHGLDVTPGLLLALHRPDMADEPGALLYKFRLRGGGWDIVFRHLASHSLLVMAK